MFTTSIFFTDRNSGVDRTEVTADTADQHLILENYRDAHDISLTFQHDGGPLPNYSRIIDISKALYNQFWRIVPNRSSDGTNTGQSETHRDNEGNVRVKCKNIKPSSNFSEWGAFPLLYPYGELHVPFGIGTYVTSNSDKYELKSQNSVSVTERFRNYSKIT